jgi:FkbM family methyltransferase
MPGLINSFKEFVAKIFISIFTLTWRGLRKLSPYPFPVKDHYYIMRIFRSFFQSFFVWTCYPNPLIPKIFLHLKLNLCENNQQIFFRHRANYDIAELRFLAKGMENGKAFLDVGSNIGVYATTIAQAFPDKEVVAFEPLPANFRSLEENIARNNILNCKTYNKAVSDAGEPLKFHVNPIHDGGGSIVPPDIYRTGDVKISVENYRQRHPDFEPCFTVETVALDDIITHKSVLKIDVEGAELDVLRSGYNSFKKGLIDLVIVEVTKETVCETIRLLNTLHFDCFLFPECELVSPDVQLSWFVRNLLCLRRGTAVHAELRNSQDIK